SQMSPTTGSVHSRISSPSARLIASSPLGIPAAPSCAVVHRTALVSSRSARTFPTPATRNAPRPAASNAQLTHDVSRAAGARARASGRQGRKGPLTIRRLRTTAMMLVLLAGPAGAFTFTVNSTGDAMDANTGDDTCGAVGGGCTLRAAI